MDRLTRLLALLPPNARRLVQALPQSDALAAAYLQRYPASCYQYAGGAALPGSVADRHYPADLDQAPDAFFAQFAMADGWLFDTALETLAAPQAVLASIARHLPLDGCVIACVANPACWNGNGQGIAPADLLAMLTRAGLRLVSGVALLGPEPDAAQLELLRERAAQLADPEQALRDALPSHYLIKACPA